MQELGEASIGSRSGMRHGLLHKGLLPFSDKEALHVIVGKKINERLTKLEIPTVPDKINSAEDLFSLAEQQAHSRWFAASQDSIIPIIRESVSDIEDKPTNENLLKLKNDPSQYSPISAEEYVYALLTGNQNDIIGLTENSNSIERMYGLVAKIIISELCLSGAVVLKGGKISIVDPLAGLYRINSLGEEIKKLCRSSNLNPAKVRKFLQKLERGLPKEGDSVKILELFKARKKQ